MHQSYNLRASRDTHQLIDKKLAKANVQRAKRGKSPLSKGAFVAHMAEKAVIRDLVEA